MKGLFLKKSSCAPAVHPEAGAGSNQAVLRVLLASLICTVSCGFACQSPSPLEGSAQAVQNREAWCHFIFLFSNIVQCRPVIHAPFL